MVSYNLPHRSFDEQIDLIESRGIVVGDRDKARHWLGRVGYYRLRPYWKALIRNESVIPGADFAHAVDLYQFDMRFRQCLFRALERIEIALRVDVSHALGRRDQFGHRSLASLDAKEWRRHGEWLDQADKQIEDCREPWVSEFQSEYEGHVPVWMAVEAWSFSTVSKLYGLLHQNDRATIAKRYVVNPQTFASWMRTCATVRNSCAHYNRVWNKPLIDQPAVPQSWEAKLVQHISASRRSQTRAYAVVAIVAHCLMVLKCADNWKREMKALALSFPLHTQLSLEDAGFPLGWETQALWQ